MELDDEELEATKKLNGTDKKKVHFLNSENIDKIQMQQKEEQQQLLNMKSELIEKEYKSNLKEYMEDKLFDLVHKLKHTEKGEEMSVIELKTLLTQKNILGNPIKYTNTELTILFDYYKQFILEINKKQKYLPTIKNFCSFIGISSNQYKNWKQSDDSERREIMQIIDDYISDVMLSSAQDRKVDTITTIFRAKSEHGMTEAQAPVVIEHKNKTDMDKILQDIETIKQGGNLIELEEKEDGRWK